MIVTFDHKGNMRALLLLLAVAAPLVGAAGFVRVDTDSFPAQVYLDATTVVMSDGPRVVEALPGKHFVSLFPPRKVYHAAGDQAPEQFWEELRRVGAIGDRRELLASYEAGAVRVGTSWVYVVPGETSMVRLSRTEVSRTYRRDSGCAMRTFLGWALIVGAAMVFSVILAASGE
jgi:hypothetical protein